MRCFEKHLFENSCFWIKLDIRCIFSFLNAFSKRRKIIKFRITPECFSELFVLVNNDITKWITNLWDEGTPKLNLLTKILHVDSFVFLFSSFFLPCSDLKFDLVFFMQPIWWIRTCQIFVKFDQTKMFQILLYTLSNLFDSTNLFKLIWPCIGSDLSIVDWFK